LEFTPGNQSRVGDSLFLSFYAESVPNVLCSLSGTTMDDGSVLNIQRSDENPVLTSELYNLLLQFFEINYHRNEGFLELDNMVAVFACHGVNVDFTSHCFMNTFAKAIRKKAGDVQILSLSRNKIDSLKLFTNVFWNLPNIRKVSFENNNISSFRELEHVKNEKITDLILR
jgi:Leucine-rich repeat (LRR) protein